MADEKHEIQSEAGGAFDRRNFFVKLGLGSLGIAAAGTAVFAYQFLSPNVLYEPSPLVNAGKPEIYPVNSVTLDVNSAIYLIHSTEGFFALGAVCTHLGCLTAWKAELGIIACPCHGSKFAVLQERMTPGEKLEGPAPKPLPWLRTWLNDDGDLMVDRGTTIRALDFLRI
ncbi:MAG TPA: Rieske 2Fe-2S domain-containing protein [Terriglobales bacterium]|nr:Rieske 2Fe-2S domain-containing protein [Terriglobales bacterium]